MEAPEHDWLDQYRRGDVEALGKLVEHFRRPLFGFIVKMTEGRGDADEIFQEAWFRAIKNLDGYRDQRFLSWMFRIAHNLIIDRARKARPQVDLGTGNGSDEQTNTEAIANRFAAPGIGPAGETSGRDLGRRISDAVSRLPHEQREVFLMRMEGDLPFKEIAKVQGTSLNTALSRMQYALTKLRVELKSDYEHLAGVRP